MINELKYKIYITKEWFFRLFIYPQSEVVPGRHFDYDAYWKERRGEYMGRLGRWQRKRAELSAEIIRGKGGESVNDIGSGAGEVLKKIIDNVAGAKGVAYDSSPYALEIAKANGLKTVELDVNRPEDMKKIEPADFTIIFEVLEHIPGPEELLWQAMNKSKIGVLFSIPNTGFFIYRFRLMFFGRFPLQWAKHPGEHLRYWTKRDLIWWLRAQGYAKYKINYYVGIPILRQLWPSMFAAGFFVELYK